MYKLTLGTQSGSITRRSDDLVQLVLDIAQHNIDPFERVFQKANGTGWLFSRKENALFHMHVFAVIDSITDET